MSCGPSPAALEHRRLEQERWITRTVGANASQLLRDILRRTVLEGPWFLEDVSPYRFRVQRTVSGDEWPPTYERLTIHTQHAKNETIRFGSATIERIEPLQHARRRAEVEQMIAGDPEHHRTARRHAETLETISADLDDLTDQVDLEAYWLGVAVGASAACSEAATFLRERS